MPFIGQQPTTGAFLELDSLTASATDQYTLQLNGANYYPESVNNLLVSINGVIQGSNTLSLSGSILTVGATLSASDVIDFVRVFGNVGTISTPTDGSVTANKIASGAVTDVKIDTMSSSKLTGALPSSVTSSGVYLGGTGSANYLDDYEEGTWTPAYTTSGGSFSYDTATQGQYTKIGNVVTLYFRIYTTNSTVGTGNVTITGLPFAEAIPSGQGAGSIGDCRLFGGDTPNTLTVYESLITPYYRDAVDGQNYALVAGDLDSGTGPKNLIDGQITYITS